MFCAASNPLEKNASHSTILRRLQGSEVGQSHLKQSCTTRMTCALPKKLLRRCPASLDRQGRAGTMDHLVEEGLIVAPPLQHILREL
eukprot:CAMPEP_0195595426 /NCGR_PEP_ID=MMETSP0815-20121206/1931_1 /TAXON_ID=97485 /ORGANISM="Prymnesium parvum, Strain Texoma1" /LENGTH=86 /DNA_ID=CAMNT_0040734671 /DNA_START=1326 /DNA_END=1583 /DNA_ORIENTATION=+